MINLIYLMLWRIRGVVENYGKNMLLYLLFKDWFGMKEPNDGANPKMLGKLHPKYRGRNVLEGLP
jgi:hypothetical protein